MLKAKFTTFFIIVLTAFACVFSPVPTAAAQLKNNLPFDWFSSLTQSRSATEFFSFEKIKNSPDTILVTKTWDGGGATNNWSDAANWSDDIVPTANDVVIFDATSTKDAAIDVEVNNSNLIQINSGYTGTITQAAGVSVGLHDFSQSSGTFVCGGIISTNALLTLNGGTFDCGAASDFNALSGTNMFLNGGTFKMPAGNLNLGGANGAGIINRGANATLLHNNGTLVLKQGKILLDSNEQGTQDFNNVTMLSSDNKIGGTMRVLGLLSLQGGILRGSTGVVEAQGAVTISSNFGGSGFSIPFATLKIAGNAARTIDVPVGMPADFVPFVVDAPNALVRLTGAGTVSTQALTLNQGTFETGTTALNVGGVYLQTGGTFVCGGGLVSLNNSSFIMNGGTFDCAASDINSPTPQYFLNGGTFNMPSGNFTLGGANGASIINRGANATLNHSNGTLVLVQSTIELPSRQATQDLNNLTIMSSTTNMFGTFRVHGALNLQSGFLRDGTLDAQKNVTIGSGFRADDGFRTNMIFSGSLDQIYTNNGGENPRGQWSINKPAGTTLTATTSLNLQTNQNLNITSGTLYLNENSNLTLENLTVGASGKLVNESATTITLGGNVSNAGIIDLNGGGASCPDNDTILIRSSDTNIRNWTGNGRFRLIDVDVQRMTGAGTTKNVFSGTNSGSVTTGATNWNFIDGCPTALSITPSTVGLQIGATQTFTAGGGFAPLTFSIPTNNSGGSISPTSGFYTAGTTAGVTDTVRVTDAFGATADAQVTTFGAANKLAFTVQPSNATAGQTISPTLQVAVQDQSGNTITNSSAAITLSISNNPSSGTLAGTLTKNAVNGIASFDNLSINRAGNSYTLRANSNGLTAATSNAFDISVGTASKLAFVVQPSNANINEAITPPVQVQIQDALGNPVAADDPIMISLANNPSGGNLTGTLTKNAVNGRATFNNLKIDALGSGYTLNAASGSLISAVSAAFNISSPFVVTNTNDNGAGSLRQAIINANQAAGTQTISFNIPGNAPFTFFPLTPLPRIDRTMTIDGTTQTGYAGTPIIEINGANAGTSATGFNIFAPNVKIKGLTINRFGSSAIAFQGISANGGTVQDNYIGTNAAGNAALPNLRGISSFGAVGLTIERNLISGNVFVGVFVSNALDSDNLTKIRQNLIGTDATGQNAIPNNTGIRFGGFFGPITSRTAIIGGDTVADANTIKFNTGTGVFITQTTAGISIRRNRIHSNGFLGINLKLSVDDSSSAVTQNDPQDSDPGANGLQNYPNLTSATSFGGNTTIQGIFNSKPSQSYELDFYSSPTCDATGFGEGETYLGSKQVTIDAGGIVGFTANLPVPTALGRVITATATDAQGNTSEFSRCSSSVADATFSVSGRITDGAGNPISGVTVNIQGTRRNTFTNTDGNYSFNSLPAGQNYTLVPSKANHVFTPANRTIINLSANQTNQNFTGTAARFQITGKITSLSPFGNFSLSGVTLNLSGAASATATSDNFGNYVFTNLLAGTYVVTPSKPNHFFNPASVTVTINVENHTVNFDATGIAGLGGRVIWDNFGTGIQSMNADGSGLATVVPFVSQDVPFHPSLSANGRKMVFFNGGGSLSQIGSGIRTANFDGSNISGILSPAINSTTFPIWSPNLNEIAFIAEPSVNQQKQIIKMSADGSNRTVIIPANKYEIDWSPDSSKFVFSRDNTSTFNGSQIFSVNVNGTNLTRLTNNNFNDSNPNWSPDGTKIAFIRWSPGSISTIVVMNADGTNQSIVYSSEAGISDLDWSPDGSRLIFVQCITGRSFSKLLTILADGTQELTISEEHPSFNVSWGGYNTLPLPIGLPVSVSSGRVNLIFTGVSNFANGANQTITIEPVSPQSLGTLPANLAFSNIAYEISVQNAAFTPPITLCLTMPNDVYLTSVAFDRLRILYKVGGTLNDITTTRDFAARQVCGESNSLGSFAVAEQIDPNLPRISGIAVDSNGDPMSGVSMNLSGAENRTTVTDSDGYFSFVNLTPNENYNVSPKQVGYLFEEYNQDFVNLTNEQTVVFQGTANNFSISGQITDGGGAASGVTVTLDGAAAGETQTDANGNYTFSNLPADGFYNVTPTDTMRSFSPSSAQIDSLTSDAAGVDFEAVVAPTAANALISGRVTTSQGNGILNVIVTLTNSNGVVRQTRTGSFGYYSFDDLPVGETYILSVTAKSYIFANPTRVIGLQEDLADADFTAQERK